MPKGPQGQKRKADVIGNAVVGDRRSPRQGSAGTLGLRPARRPNRKGGLKAGGKARAKVTFSQKNERRLLKGAAVRSLEKQDLKARPVILVVKL